MASGNITTRTNLATPQPTMLLYGALSPFGATDDRKVTANALFQEITANVSDVSIQFGDGVAAAVSAASKGKIIYNATAQAFQVSENAGAYISLVKAGLITASGLTQNTSRLLGRTTAGVGAIEEISISTGLSLAAGVLSNTLSPGGVTNSVQINNGGGLFDGDGKFTYDIASSTVLIGSSAGVGNLKLRGTGASNGFTLKVNSPSGNNVYTLPDALPTLNQLLQATAVSGVNVTLGWSTVLSAPFSDANPLVMNSADNTKLLTFSAASITTLTTRTLTAQDADYTIAGTTVALGGTGAATFTSNGVLYGNGTGALQVTAQGTANSILTANAGAPSFSQAPIVNTSVQIGVASSATGSLKLAHASSANLTTIQAGNATAAVTYTWPTADGSSGQVLSTNGSGVLSWATAGGSVTWGAIGNPVGNLSLDMSTFVTTQTANTAITNAVNTLWTFGHNTSGTPAANFGTQLKFVLESTSTVDRDAGAFNVYWSTATDASRTSRVGIGTVNIGGSPGTLTNKVVIGNDASQRAFLLIQNQDTQSSGDVSRLYLGSASQYLEGGHGSTSLQLNTVASGGNIVFAANFPAKHSFTISGVEVMSVSANNPGVAITGADAARVAYALISAANTSVDLAQYTLTADDTSTVANLATYNARSNGTAAAGFGQSFTYTLESSTTNDRAAMVESILWTTATDASRAARTIWNIYDTAAREAFRIEASGSAPMIGFLGANAAIRQTGGAATAGAVYTATEQAMLQAAYDCLRTFGLLT